MIIFQNKKFFFFANLNIVEFIYNSELFYGRFFFQIKELFEHKNKPYFNLLY